MELGGIPKPSKFSFRDGFEDPRKTYKIAQQF
jgi:hypothetical protein